MYGLLTTSERNELVRALTQHFVNWWQRRARTKGTDLQSAASRTELHKFFKEDGFKENVKSSNLSPFSQSVKLLWPFYIVTNIDFWCDLELVTVSVIISVFPLLWSICYFVPWTTHILLMSWISEWGKSMIVNSFSRGRFQSCDCETPSPPHICHTCIWDFMRNGGHLTVCTAFFFKLRQYPPQIGLKHHPTLSEHCCVNSLTVPLYTRPYFLYRVHPEIMLVPDSGPLSTRAAQGLGGAEERDRGLLGQWRIHLHAQKARMAMIKDGVLVFGGL